MKKAKTTATESKEETSTEDINADQRPDIEGVNLLVFSIARHCEYLDRGRLRH